MFYVFVDMKNDIQFISKVMCFFFLQFVTKQYLRIYFITKKLNLHKLQQITLFESKPI